MKNILDLIDGFLNTSQPKRELQKTSKAVDALLEGEDDIQVGDAVIFSNLIGSYGDWGFENEDEYERYVKAYEDKRAVVTAEAIESSYYDIEFEDGHSLRAVSREHLKKPGSHGQVKQGWGDLPYTPDI